LIKIQDGRSGIWYQVMPAFKGLSNPNEKAADAILSETTGLNFLSVSEISSSRRQRII